MTAADPATRLRRFNRFFTLFVGALDPRFLGTDLTLAEARLLYEIAQSEAPLARALGDALAMDAGFVSRVLRRFETRGWIERLRGPADGRQRPIRLTPAGQAAFAELDQRQQAAVEAQLDRLRPAEREQLAAALDRAKNLLDPAAPPRPVALRAFRAGDMGMITARQAILYREGFGWGPQIESLVGEVTARFLRNFKPGRENAWIAELGGEMAGSVMLTDEGDGLCRLRLLYVEPFAQGYGIGKQLVSRCVAFGREAGFREMVLWTHSILTTARAIYAQHGFILAESEMHDRFGVPLMGETWRLDLTRAAQPAESEA